jgi:hypothetical protein
VLEALCVSETKTNNLGLSRQGAREVVNENKCKVKKLDIRFAASVVGDGSNGITGPFE